MRDQVIFFLPLKLEICYFGNDPKILLANQFAGYFAFGLFDLLNLIPGVHCYIVLFFSWTHNVIDPLLQTELFRPENDQLAFEMI